MHAPAGPTIRALASQPEFEACVALQRATWGDDFRELVPPAVLQVAQKMGGIVAGAFADGGDLIGFVFGLTGIRDGAVAHWSHMLAVAEPWRDRGIGGQLKAYQRATLAAAGVTRMFWTFDPLVARNAHLNLRRLGARVVEYVRDMYGDNPMSRTDSVIGSDRFVVSWNLDTPAPIPPDATPHDAPRILGAGAPLPDAPAVLVGIPGDIQQLKQADPAGARGWRTATRRAFEHYLPRGYAVTDFVRGAGDAPGTYVLTRDA